MAKKLIREVLIKGVADGFTVTVGCLTLVYETHDKLLADLREYLLDPEAKEGRMFPDGPPVSIANIGVMIGVGDSIFCRDQVIQEARANKKLAV